MLLVHDSNFFDFKILKGIFRFFKLKFQRLADVSLKSKLRIVFFNVRNL